MPLLLRAALVVAALGGIRPAQAGDDYLAQLIGQARATDLASAPQWRALLHYRRARSGHWISEADGLGFFLAGRAGRSDPARELEAALVAFGGPARPDPGRAEETQHPQCRFPARWAFLKRALAIDPGRLPDQRCPLYAMWHQAIAAERVTLVYASAYLNSPASMYGHTFFRLSRATGEGNPLLDYIVNFAADIDTNNGFLYALEGLTGGFAGHFFTMPYYMKIQEYSHMESRDLWEYELSLGPEQIERLVAHTWETRTTHFDYYFFSENCAYFLLTLLEAADPSLHLTDGFPAWVIPADTVRAVLDVPGLVRSVAARPSLHAAMMAHKEGLAAAEATSAEGLARRGKEAAPTMARMTPARQAAVLDAAYERLRYTEGGHEPPSDRFSRVERDLLVLRGRTGEAPAVVSVEPAIDAPERGHRTLRLGLDGGVRRLGAGGAPGGFQELSLRLAIHDQLDPPSGYVPDAALEMVNVAFRIDDDQRNVSLDHLDLVQIISPAPLDRWALQTSWSARIGARQERALGCNGWSCLAGGLEAGGGVALRLGRPLLVYGLVESAVAGGAPFQDRFRIGLGGSATALLRLGAHGRTRLGARWLYYFLGDDRRSLAASIGQAWDLGRRVQLRLTAEAGGRYREARLELLGYLEAYDTALLVRPWGAAGACLASLPMRMP